MAARFTFLTRQLQIHRVAWIPREERGSDCGQPSDGLYLCIRFGQGKGFGRKFEKAAGYI